ncbi:MAG: hypothetical protein ONB23_05350 [candidate division KSB1 bacterium]|nr:hypothetical protein [candidate division KSB1 bacterium]
MRKRLRRGEGRFRSCLSALAFLLFWSQAVQASPPGVARRLIELLSWRDTGQGIEASCLTTAGDTLLLRVDVYGTGIFRLRLGRYRHSRGERAQEARLAPVPPYRIWSRPEELGLLTAELRLRIERVPLRLSFHGSEGELLTAQPPDAGLWSATDATGETFVLRAREPLFGLGEPGALTSDHGFHRRANASWSATGPLAFPFLFSERGYGVFLHTAATYWFETGEPDRSYLRFWHEAVDTLDYFFIGASSPEQLLQRYTGLVGRSPLLPAWAMGVWFVPAPFEDPVAPAAGFRHRGIPLDVLVLAGTAAKGAPDATMLHRMGEGLRELLVHVGVECAAPEVEAGAGARQGGRLGESLCSGSWPTLQPEVLVLRRGRDPLPLTDAQRLVQRAVRELSAGPSCPILAADLAWPGSQRYAVTLVEAPAPGWSGLEGLLRNGLGGGPVGVALWGATGVRAEGVLTPEFYIRSLQLSLFLPVAFLSGEVLGRPPWELGEEALRAYRRLAGLRMQLLPYLYHLAAEAHRSGVPVTRPLALYCPEARADKRWEGEFLLGQELLVAPVTEPSRTGDGTVVRSVFLPEGQWYDFWSHLRFQGPRELSYKADLAHCPLFVRAGAILPQAFRAPSVAEMDWDPLWLVLYPGSGDGERDLLFPAFPDRCEGLLTLRVTARWGDTVEVRLEPLRKEGGQQADPRGLLLQIVEFEAEAVSVEGQLCPELEDPSQADGRHFGWAIRRALGSETLVSLPASRTQRPLRLVLLGAR